MRNSKIDGKGLLPYICSHGKGYNSTAMCFECAEDRADELERVIAMLGDAVLSARMGIDSERPALLVRESLQAALTFARGYFDSRPTARPSDRELGGWLIEQPYDSATATVSAHPPSP
jgi:hypothetical protein